MIRTLLPALAALSFLGIGAGAAIAPEALAENYGLPIDDDTGRAYVRGLGVRDAVIGMLIVAFLASRNKTALATTLCVSALVGASDFAVVFRARGDAAAGSLAIHATGAVGLAVLGALAVADARP